MKTLTDLAKPVNYAQDTEAFHKSQGECEPRRLLERTIDGWIGLTGR